MKIIWCWDSGFHQCLFTLIHIIRNVRITHTHSIQETILAIHLCALSVCRFIPSVFPPVHAYHIKFYAAVVAVLVVAFSSTNFSLIALSSMTKRNNESRDSQRRATCKSERGRPTNTEKKVLVLKTAQKCLSLTLFHVIFHVNSIAHMDPKSPNYYSSK